MPRKNIHHLSLKIEPITGALKNDFLSQTAPHVREWTIKDDRGLSISEEKYGQGGTAIVYKGSFIGQNVAIKVTTIDEGLAHKYIDRIGIFNSLNGIDAVLLPIATFVRSGANIAGVENESIELLEVYPVCEKYELPRSQKEFLEHILFLLNGILKMHSRAVAHLDFKILNLLYYTSQLGIRSPIISDLGESRSYDIIFSKKPDQVSTSITLIIENIWIKSLCKYSVLYLNSPIELRSIKYLLMNHTPRSLYPIIDSLMIGIFLANLSENPLLNGKIYYGLLTTDISQCGKELLVSSLYSLYHHWELSSKGTAIPLFDAFDPFKIGLMGYPSRYSIRNLRDLFCFLEGVLGRKTKFYLR